MPYTLIVVDMQHHFYAARGERVLNNVAKEIKMAIKERAAIVFVEYLGCGPTISNLLSLSDDYDRAYAITKDQDDGAREVIECLKDRRLPKRHLRVCGVNTDFCVRSTVESLACDLPMSTIEVISRSCNSYSDSNHKRGLKMFESISNVFIS